MKITDITVSNFLGLRDFRHKLTAPFLFVAGPNGAGKTSLQDAIRFAVDATLARVKKAGDRDMLITEGAAAGYVEIGVDGFQVRRTIGSNKLTKDAPPMPEGIGLCLDASRFARMDDGDRRRLLFALSGVKTDKASVARQLQDDGVPDDFIEKAMPMLAGGFPAAAQFSRDQATAARGGWKAVTGEVYGSQKAVTWTASMPSIPITDSEIEEERANVARCEQKISALMGAAARVAAAVNPERLAELRVLAADADVADAELVRAQDAYDTAAAHQRALDAEIKGHAGHTFPCPSCGANLEQTVGGVQVAAASNKPTSQAKQAAAVKAATKATADAYSELQHCRRVAATAAAAKQTLADLPAGPTAEDMQAPELLDEERRRRASHAEKLAVLERGKREQDQAAEITARAAACHREAATWAKLEQLFGPDGIPATLLASALDPINDALSAQAARAAWRPATIGRDLGLLYDGRSYALCSESEQWRADALFAAVIAVMSGAGILMLDRFDVLEPAARGDAIDWLASLIDCGIETVIVSGTLKAKPDLGEGIDVVWLPGRVADA